MNGGEIKNNTATYGGGIYLTQESLVEMYGGEISDNLVEPRDTENCLGGGIYGTYSEITISGGKISNNTAVSTENTDSTGGGIHCYNLKLTIEKGEISQNRALSGGGIFAATSVIDMSGGEISHNVLNEGLAFGFAGGIFLSTSSQFTMTGGKISHNQGYQGGGIHASSASTITLENGEITGNTSIFGSGVDLMRDTLMTMSGGKISDNSAVFGGGVNIYFGGSFSMSQGDISSNTADQGGGVNVDSDAEFSMSGGLIFNNVASASGSGICTGGQFHLRGPVSIPDEINVYGGSYITLGNNFSSLGTSIPISMETPGQFTQGAKSSDISNFTSYNPSYSISYVNGTELSLSGSSTPNYDDPNDPFYNPNVGNPDLEYPDSNLPDVGVPDTSGVCPSCGQNHNNATAITAGGTYSASGHYYLPYDLTADLKFVGNGESATHISLCLNDKTLRGTGTSTVVYLENLTFNLYGGQSGLGTITGGTGYDNSRFVCGGGIYGDSVSFEIHSGNVSNNSASTYAGGMFFTDSNVTMYDGQVSHNNSTLCCGIMIQESIFYMHGGSITDNYAENNVGGLFLVYSEMVMTGGSISNNESPGVGGLYADSSTITLNGGTISQNKGYDGGVSLGQSSIMTMNGGSITDNVSHDYIFGTGGVSVSTRSVFQMNGGQIENNVGMDAGGLSTDLNGSSIIMTGGTISGNKATTTEAHGIYFQQDPPDSTNGSSSLVLKGTVNIQDAIFVDMGKLITIESTFQNNSTASIPIVMTIPTQFTQGISNPDKNNFSSYDPLYQVEVVTGTLELGLIPNDQPVVPEYVGPLLSDTASDWAQSLIEEAYQLGLLSGMNDLSINYQADITREQFCRLVMNVYDLAGGTRPVTPNSSFTDTNNPDVLAANALGIVSGTSVTKFSPDAYIKRQELAIMVLRVAEYFTQIPELSTELNFTDKDSIDSWAKSAVYYAQLEGFLIGSGGKLLPYDYLSCEEAIAVTLRLLQKFG